MTGGILSRAWKAGVALLLRERTERDEFLPVGVTSDASSWPGNSLVEKRPHLSQCVPVSLDSVRGDGFEGTEELYCQIGEGQYLRVRNTFVVKILTRY